MKSFDLDAAKRGAAVCTRDGRSARIICFDVDNIEYSIVANVRSGKQLKSESAQLYCRSGKWYPATAESGSDLMMRDDDYLEKLERGEYAPSVKENLTVENPTCKESLPVDREYWRRVYAGQIMPVVFHAAITTGAKVKDEYKDMPADVAVARSAIILADALLAELDETEKK